MDWEVKPLGRHSWASQDAFAEGDRVVCFLFVDEGGELQRADVREHESERFAPPGRLLGRWTRVVKGRAEEERAWRRQQLLSTEELFLSTFEVDAGAEGEDAGERALWQYLLGLMLERRRVLRALGRPAGGVQLYLHVKSKREYRVEVMEVEGARALAMVERLQALVS